MRHVTEVEIHILPRIDALDLDQGGVIVLIAQCSLVPEDCAVGVSTVASVVCFASSWSPSLDLLAQSRCVVGVLCVILFVQISHNHNNKSPKAERDIGPPPSLRINYKSNTTINYYYYLKGLSGPFNLRSCRHRPLTSINTTLASLYKVHAPQPSSTLLI